MSVNGLNVDLVLLVIFFLDTLAICISPSSTSFLFEFRFPVIHLKIFVWLLIVLGVE